MVLNSNNQQLANNNKCKGFHIYNSLCPSVERSVGEFVANALYPFFYFLFVFVLICLFVSVPICLFVFVLICLFVYRQPSLSIAVLWTMCPFFNPILFFTRLFVHGFDMK